MRDVALAIAFFLKSNFNHNTINLIFVDTAKETWQVIYTRPRHEKKVADHLGLLEVQHYLPITKTVKIYQGRKKFVSLPLFPSYVFVKPTSTQQYLDSLHVPGVLNYVRTGKKISGVSETTINKLKGIEQGSIYDVQVSADYFSPGSIMNIQFGPFSGFSCEIVQYKGRHKMLVRLELLQRTILVDMPEEYLRPF